MTNPRTGAAVIVRIVDQCGHGGETTVPDSRGLRAVSAGEGGRAGPHSQAPPRTHPPTPAPNHPVHPPPPRPGIDADQQSAFIPLDVDQAGYAAGNMQVNLDLVAC